MDDNPTLSSNVQTYDSTDLPSGWVDRARISTIIAEKFIAFKTPLDGRFNPYIRIENRWTCEMLIKNIKDNRKNLGLVIDLTNTDRFYISNIEFNSKNIRYEKIRCEEDDEIPNDEQIYRFIQICQDFINTNSTDLIGVHCTYGFNRTGFLICAYLCQELNLSIHNAIDIFAKARSPGMDKQDYLNKLIQKFEIFPENSKPMFAVNLVDVIPICSQPLLDNIRSNCQQMCGWIRKSFPGSKSVSINMTNCETIFNSYIVSWKANGTRYMMLIQNKTHIYMLDCNNNVFQINNLSFPNRSDSSKHLTNTLLDGVFVIDNDNGNKIYRYLVFDIVVYENKNIGLKNFNERLEIIRNDIVGVRNNAIIQGLIDKSSEPFSIRIKDFWKLSEASELLDPSFQSQITHGSDGLIFQSQHHPYRSGRSLEILKWNTDNTIYFRLKIDKIGQSQTHIALLYLNDMLKSYASMRYSPILDQYDNQIIECSYHNDEWIFHRHRPDKTYPNTQATADGIPKTIDNQITKDILLSLINENTAFTNYR